MLGAIAGDIIGSVYEQWPIKTKDFRLFSARSDFTDDTVLTVAVAQVLLHGGDYAETFKRYYRRHPYRGYGANFSRWASQPDMEAYYSFGNGSAMRVSPIGWAFDDLSDVLEEAQRSAAATHSHPEGIKGAQSTAAAIFLARSGQSKDEIREYVQTQFGYDLDRQLDQIRPGYHFDVTCQGSVPEAILCFLESEDYEDAVRNAVSLGGDSDTQACIAGSIAEAYDGGVPEFIREEIFERLDEELAEVVRQFAERYRTT